MLLLPQSLFWMGALVDIACGNKNRGPVPCEYEAFCIVNEKYGEVKCQEMFSKLVQSCLLSP